MSWLTPADVADHTGHHVVTVYRALESGQLHGHQPRRGARWRIAEPVADAWVTGLPQTDACGCTTALTRGRKTA
ncbi:helix-turn-helix domain-containing protein [Saccharopolyspora sp. NPDC002376]